jgi:ABC-2 type transport system permease protein
MKGSVRRVKGMIIKEFYQIFRDPSNVMIAFVLPAILLFIYSFGISLDYKNLRIGMVLQDDNVQAINLAHAFTNSKYFHVDSGRTFQEYADDLIAGHIKGIVVIPSYFSEYVYRPDRVGPVQVITDGSEPNAATFVYNYAQGAWLTWLSQTSLETGRKQIFQIRPQPRFWYNEELESRYFLLPGSIALIMTLIGTLLTALVIAREWERGTMEALMAMPVTVGEILLSKLIPYYVLGIASLTFCVLFATLFIGVPYRGSYFALWLVSSAFLLAALGAGLLISSLSRNQFVAYQGAVVTGFLPAFMLSGFIFEISSMPYPIQLITYLIPARYFVSALQTLFLVGNVWSVLLPNMLAMILFAMILFTITLSKSVKRLD